MERTRIIPLVVALLAALPRPAFAQTRDPADALFNDQVLHEIRLSVNSRDLQSLKEHWQDETKYPADFRWNDQVVRNVSIKSHGGGSRRPNKLSLKVTFDHYTTGQTFLGLHSVLLRNNSQDATNVRERVLKFRIEAPITFSTERAPQAFRYVESEDYGRSYDREAPPPQPHVCRGYDCPPPPPLYAYPWPGYYPYYSPGFAFFYGPRFFRGRGFRFRR